MIFSRLEATKTLGWFVIWWDQLQTWIRWQISFIQGYLTYGEPPARLMVFLIHASSDQWSEGWASWILHVEQSFCPKHVSNTEGCFRKIRASPPENDSSHAFGLFSSFFGPWEKRIFNITRSTKHPEGYQHLETPERAARGGPNKKHHAMMRFSLRKEVIKGVSLEIVEVFFFVWNLCHGKSLFEDVRV